MAPTASTSCLNFFRSPSTEDATEYPSASGSEGVLEITADFLIPPERFLKNRIVSRYIRLLNGVLQIHKSEKSCRKSVAPYRFIPVNDMTNVCVQFMPVGSKKKNYLCIMTEDESFNIYVDTTAELKEWYEAVLKQLIRVRSERLKTQASRFDFFMMAWDVTVKPKPTFAPIDDDFKNKDITLMQPYLLSNGGKHRFALVTNSKTVVLILRGLSDDVEIPPEVKDKLTNGNELRVPFSAISFHTVTRKYVTIRFGRSSALGGGVAWFDLKTEAEAQRIYNSIRAWTRFDRDDSQNRETQEMQSNPTESCLEDVVHYEGLMRQFFETDNPQLEAVSAPPPPAPPKRSAEPAEEPRINGANVVEEAQDPLGNDYKSGPVPPRSASNSANRPDGVPNKTSTHTDTLQPETITPEKKRDQAGYVSMIVMPTNARNGAKAQQPLSVCSYASGSSESFMSPNMRSNAASLTERDRSYPGEPRTGSRTSAKSESSDDSRARAHSMSTAEEKKSGEKIIEMRPRVKTLPANIAAKESARNVLQARRQQMDHEMLDFAMARADSNTSNRKSASRQSNEFRSPSSSVNAGVGSRKASASKRPNSEDNQMASDNDGYLPMTYSDASTISLPHRPNAHSNASTKSFNRRGSLEDLSEPKDDYVLQNTPLQQFPLSKPGYMETISEGNSPSVSHKYPKLVPHSDDYAEKLEYAKLEFGDPIPREAPDTPNSENNISWRKISTTEFTCDYSEIAAPGSCASFQHETPSPKKEATKTRRRSKKEKC